MSCSSNSRAPAGFGPRLFGALAASAALHTLLAAGLQQPFGRLWGDVSWSWYPAPIRAVLVSAVADAARSEAPAVPPVASPDPEPQGPAARSLLPQPHYFLTKELDVRPGIMTRVEPEYPEAAARHFLSGKVMVRLYIGASGAVDRVDVLSADPPGYFEAAAERAFRAALFSPGMKDGKPVPVQVTLEVNFDSASAPELPGSQR